MLVTAVGHDYQRCASSDGLFHFLRGARDTPSTPLTGQRVVPRIHMEALAALAVIAFSLTAPTQTHVHL